MIYFTEVAALKLYAVQLSRISVRIRMHYNMCMCIMMVCLTRNSLSNSHPLTSLATHHKDSIQCITHSQHCSAEIRAWALRQHFPLKA